MFSIRIILFLPSKFEAFAQIISSQYGQKTTQVFFFLNHFLMYLYSETSVLTQNCENSENSELEKITMYELFHRVFLCAISMSFSTHSIESDNIDSILQTLFISFFLSI